MTALAFAMTLALAPHERLAVYGIARAGKSTFVQREIIAHAERVVLFNPHGDYDGLTDVALGDFVGNPELADADGARLQVIPDWTDPEELGAQLRAFADTLAACERDTLVVVEEAGLIEDGEGVRALKYLATQAGHFGDEGMPLVLVSQRAAMVPKTARAQCSRVVTFRQTDDEDLDALRSKFGARTDRIQSLARFEHMEWRADDFAEKPNRAGKDKSR